MGGFFTTYFPYIYMAKIVVLEDKGNHVLPLTVTDAVRANDDSASLTEIIASLEDRVSLLDGLFGIDTEGNVYVKPAVGGHYRTFYNYGAISTKGVSDNNSGGTGGIDITVMWDSLKENNALNVIHISHIPTLSTTKIADFASSVQALLPNVPTNVSELVNDAGYLTATAIANKADKATTIQGYGLWEKYTDLNDAPMGAFFCGGTSVANSPESGNYISGLTLAKDKNTQYRTQLGFVNNRVFTRQENGANNWSQWRELAFLGDVAKKATTLAGYGITDAIPQVDLPKNDIPYSSMIGYGYQESGFPASGGFMSAVHSGGKYGFMLYATIDNSKIFFKSLNNGVWYNSWTEIAKKATTLAGYGITDAVTLDTNQTITAEKVFQTGGSSNVPLRIRNTADSAHIQAGSSGTNNTASLTISGLGRSMLNSLQVYATNTAFHGSISTTKIRGITDSSAVANLHAQYSTNLMGDDNRNVNEAPYIYGTRAVNWRFKRAKAIGLATNDNEYAGVLHLTPWNDSTGGPDHQLAFESNGKIKYRSGLSTWSDWKEVVFTDVDSLTPAGGTLTINGALKATGNSLLIGALNVSGNVNLSSMVMTNNDNGVLTLDGNYIDVNAPMNIKNIMKIGNATLYYDAATDSIVCDKNIVAIGAVSTKG